MSLRRAPFDPTADLRRVLDLAHAVWKRAPSHLNFETSFGTLAWEVGGGGRARVFERDGRLVGWARLTPGYDRIRRMGEWDVAPPSLTWLVDWDDVDPAGVLDEILEWAEARSDAPFTTSYAENDGDAERCLRARGYEPDASEPFGIYLQQRLSVPVERVLDGYRFTSMAEVDDVELRAEAHRVAWDGSTRSADDVRVTMATWPYRADLDVIALDADGEPAASAIIWFDAAYDYGEFEPVGTSAAHRGKGLASALLRFGLARLRDAGASYAVVGARGDDDYPVPRRLYRSVGFEPMSAQRIVRSSGVRMQVPRRG